MSDFLKRAVKETLLAAVTATLFSLFALSLFAVFVRAFAPTDLTITIVNQILKCVGIFLAALLFVRSERALFKGAAAGIASLLITTLLFGIIGGFHLTALFAAEILLSALMGGAGALCGAKLRKE